MDDLSLFAGVFAFIASVGLHAVFRRVQPAVNSVLAYGIFALLLFLCLGLSLWALKPTTITALATLIAYAFACELYVFLITLVLGSVTVAQLLDIADLSQFQRKAVAPEKMVSTRISGLVGCKLVKRRNGHFTIEPLGRLVVASYSELHSLFGHGLNAQDESSPYALVTGKRTTFRNRHFVWLILLALLVFAVFRDHIAGRYLYLGNFDRLNSILNVQLTDVNSLRSGGSAYWDNSMFMGRNTMALPFTVPTPFNRILSTVPLRYFYWLTGDISIALVVFAGWSAFGLILDVVRDGFSAFVGAALYQFSALSVLHAGQNTLSYAVLIDLPLLLLIARRSNDSNWCRSFIFQCFLLCHLFFFCFLQEVAYAVLALACYSIFLSFHRGNIRSGAITALALLVAAIFSVPRVYGIATDIAQLRRQISDDFRMKDFDALYYWQNFQSADILRWFNDGMFGRYYGEMQHIHNNINITEGMLAYTGTLSPFFVLSGLVIWKGRLIGLIAPANRENLFYYLAIIFGFSVIVSKQAYHILFNVFLRVDFTHTRILVAVLPFLCVVIADTIASWGGTFSLSVRKNTISRFLGAALFASVINFVFEHWSHVAQTPLALVASVRGLFAPFIGVAAGMFGSDWRPMPADGRFLIWLYQPAVAEVDAAFLIFLSVLLIIYFARKKPLARGFLLATTGLLMVEQSWKYANFQINDSHLHSETPYEDSNSFVASPNAFIPPSIPQLSEIHKILQTDKFRTVLAKGPDKLPAFTAPHIGAFWQLRLVEGYSSGVPARLGMFPWPAGTLGLRTLTFGYTEHDQLPWDLLGFLNVRFALDNTKALYENLVPGGSRHAIPHFLVIENPSRVVPRAFFAKSVLNVKNEFSASFAIRSPKGSVNRFIDPALRSVVESTTPLPPLSSDGSIDAKYSEDRIEIKVSPSSEPRLLVLNELFTPSWQASEDGKPVSVYPANLVMRSVVVGPGVRSISFDFEPFCNPLNVGIFSLLALIVAIAAIGLLFLIGKSKYDVDPA